MRGACETGKRMVDSTRMTRPLKALVLSGGKGSRLRPLTYSGAKQLVPVANRPVLFHALDDLIEAGVNDITIVVGDTADQVRAAVDAEGFPARIRYVQQDAPLGIAHAVKIARSALGTAPFVLFLGDNFIREGVAAYVDSFRTGTQDALVLLKEVDRPQDFGVAAFEGERLVRVVEKPEDPPSNLAIIGIYFFGPRVWDAVEDIRPSARGELEITDTIQWLIDHGADVRAERVEGVWIDTGKHDDLLEANRLVLEVVEGRIEGTLDEHTKLHGRERIVIEPGAVIEHSVISGPAAIGRNTRISHSYVGPFTSIDHDCVIEHSEIAGSVVMESTVISGVGHRIEHSLIGRNVEVRGEQRKPRAFHLVLGDYSRVSIP